MPTKRELYDYLDSIMPKTLSCEWDNDGFMCCPDPDAEVKRILFALDCTSDTADYAIANGFDTVITHHPLIFKQELKTFNTDDPLTKKLINLTKNDITVMSFHTRLDTVSGGVNDALAEVLGLTDVVTFNVLGQDMGRVGLLPHEMSADELALYIKEKLGSQWVNYNGKIDKIKKLAVLGGAGGGSIVFAATETGAQAYLTGELGGRPLTDACDYTINCYEAGHYFTECPVLKKLAQTISAKFADIPYEFFTSHSAKTV